MNSRETLLKSRIVAERLIHPRTDLYRDMSKCPELRGIPADKYPKTVAIIPDGNRRFASFKHMSILEGHELGANKVIDLVDAFSTLPIDTLIIWGFSTDNWNRNPDEITNIMAIMKNAAERVLPDLMDKNGRLIHLGRTTEIPTDLLATLMDAEQKTAKNIGQKVVLAIDFGGTDQVGRMINKARENPDATPESLRDGHGLIKPADLLIRTGEYNTGLFHTSDIGWINGKPTLIQPFTKSFPELTRQDVARAIWRFAHTPRSQGA